MRTRLAVTACVIAAAFASAAQADSITSADQAKAIAQAINLASADMVGYDVSPSDNSGGDLADRSVARCAHAVPSSEQMADVASDGFSLADGVAAEFVGSDAIVCKTAAEATRDRAAYFSARGRACFKKALLKEARKQQTQTLTLVAVGVTRLVPGVAAVHGMRLKMVFRSGTLRVPTFIDVFDFTRGQAEVALTAVSGPRPFAAGKSHRLLGLLTQRAAQQVPDENLAPGAPQGLAG